MSPDEPALAPGDVLARKYRLERPLGEGAMAVVWVAHNMALETKVAVKILRSALASDARLVARFRQEAKATALIAHKNIVQVYDYGITHGGAPFIVMELLQGQTLAQRLKEQGPLPAEDALRVLMRAMKGVTVAHSKGVIHRDLKPENIFLAREEGGAERPKVLDFGVSFMARTGHDERLTKAGRLLGTPSYLPPEAIEGTTRGDVRGDVWAFGVMLYETLSGQLPFQGRTVHAVIEAIRLEMPRPLRELVPELDPALEAIVLRAMAKDLDERYPGVRELYDDLNAWLGRRGLLLSAMMPSAGHLPSATPSRGASLELPADPLVDLEDPTLIGPSLEASTSPPSSRRPASSLSEASAIVPSASPLPPRVAPPRTTSSGWVAATLGLVIGTGLAGWLWVERPTETRPPAPVASAPRAVVTPSATSAAVESASPPPSASAAPMVEAATLEILGLPEHALVRLDDRRIERLPVAIERGQVVRLRVDAPGYEPWLQEFVIEGSVKLRYAARPLLVRAPSTVGSYRDVPY